MANHEAVIVASNIFASSIFASDVVAGVGCRAGCSMADIVAAVAACTRSQARPEARLLALCTADFKASSEPLQRAARELGARLLFFSRASLARHAEQILTSSPFVAQQFGLPSIAETAALAGALELSGGSGPVRLLGARQVVGGAACALAVAMDPSP